MMKTDKEVYYATGKRKCAIARVRLVPGQGRIEINGMPMAEYLERKVLELIVKEPFDVTENNNRFDVFARVNGGGKAGQAGAVRHGITRALIEYDADLKKTLKNAGLVTRDPRVKERKKYGRKRARRGFQWTKR